MFKIVSILAGIYALTEAGTKLYILSADIGWTRAEKMDIQSDMNEYLVFAFAAFAVASILHAIGKIKVDNTVN